MLAFPKDAADANQVLPFSYGTLSTEPAVATDIVKLFNTQHFGQGVLPSLFVSSALQAR